MSWRPVEPPPVVQARMTVVFAGGIWLLLWALCGIAQALAAFIGVLLGMLLTRTTPRRPW
jgi:hypothetical protein